MRIELSNLEVKVPDGQTEVFYLNNILYTGTVYWEPNNIIISEFEVKEGMKDGLEKEFIAGNLIVSEINYKEGQEEGIGKYYYESGKLKEEIYFEMSEIIWSISYDEEGKIIDKYEIDKNSSSFKRLQAYKNARANHKI